MWIQCGHQITHVNYLAVLFIYLVFMHTSQAIPAKKNVQEWYTARVTSYFTIKPLTKVILAITDQSLFYIEIREAK